MVLPLFLLALAGACLSVALEFGGILWLALWPAVGAMHVAAAYVANQPGWLGKDDHGRLSPWAWPTLGAFLLFQLARWELERRVIKPAWHLVAPGLYLGRRVHGHELPPGVVIVVDLASEFAEPETVRAGRTYVNVPALDARPPREDALVEVVGQLEAAGGPAYVHCASGHGRSATVAAAVLLKRGLAQDVEDAERQLRNTRPRVRLKPLQRAALARVLPRLTSS
jgi:protein-tyrosine phosphatase